MVYVGMTHPEKAMETASYNRYSRYLHWLMAFLIVFIVILGWRNDDHDSFRLSRISIHKSVGMLILLLTFVRVALRLMYKAPPEPPMPQWQAWAAKALHFGFYLVMIGMPLTGWLMVSTSVRPIPMLGAVPFGLEWPHLPVPQTHETHETFETIHKLIAKLLIYGMIPLHVLAALKHQFVDKDAVVQHMVPGLTPKPILNWRWLLPVGIVAAAVGLGYGIYRGAPEKGGEGGAPSGSGLQSSATSAVAPAMNADASTSSLAESSSLSASSTPVITNWAVDKSATKIGWTTTFEGEAIAGGFNSYIAQIAFDPAALDASSVKVTIDLASVASGDNDRDTSLKSDSFFNTSAFPKAVFEARSFTKKDATHFIAHGKLTLHGVTKAQDLPFTLTIKDKVANMTATTTLDRTAFGVGSGDYASTDTIPAKVGINITLQAKAES